MEMVDSITLFGVALKGSTVPFEVMNKEAAKLGYIVHPDCCTKEVMIWLKNQKADFNSTFYKTWEDVTSKSRWELLIDQLRHYASTYGTDFEGTAYIPNDMNTPVFSFENYKVIMPVTLPELSDKCKDLCSSGIALAKDTVEYCCSVIYENYVSASDTLKRKVIESLANKEAKSILYVRFDLSPIEKFALLRYIAYKQLGTAMIVQSDKTFKAIKSSPYKFDFTTLNNQQICNLSSIFLRYKKFLLAFKDDKNASVINKMRRLAKRTHTPLKPGFWETILSVKPSLDTVRKHFSEVPIFKLLLIATTIRERLLDAPGRGFIIRNGSVFMKKEMRPKNTPYEMMLYAEIINYIKSSIDKKVKLPKNFVLTCPTSEKTFVGNYPFGTQYSFKDSDAFIGIYWRNEWGTRDFDLSFLDNRGYKIGWNASYYSDSQDIIFSGDMTDANPEATEILNFRKAVCDGVVMVNRYHGAEGSRYDLILGKEKCDFSSLPRYNKRAYMVDPNNIDFRAELQSEKAADYIGVVSDSVFYFSKLQMGNQIVSNCDEDTRKIVLAKVKAAIPLSEIVTVVDDSYDGDDYVDLTGELRKDDIINLLTIKEEE